MKWSEVKLLSRVWLFETSWTVAHKASLFLGFPRQKHWSRWLPFPSPGDVRDPGTKAASPALEVGSLPLGHQESLILHLDKTNKCGREGWGSFSKFSVSSQTYPHLRLDHTPVIWSSCGSGVHSSPVPIFSVFSPQTPKAELLHVKA